MNIREIKINNYGKLNDRKIKLEDGFNIVYGKNESGKSTLLNFITSSFYGISRNKNGKTISDYDRFLPWNHGDFSGKIIYELDNKNRFEVFRDFNKKNPKIYNESFEEISNSFEIDRNDGSLFFSEQTKINKELFLSTVVSRQNEVELNKDQKGKLIQKMTNMINTGEENINLEQIMSRLNKKLIEEIGTTRTQDRPINILEKEIKVLEEEKKKLSLMKNEKIEIEKEIKIKERESKEKSNKINVLKKIKSLRENEFWEREKLKYSQKDTKEIEEKIKLIKEKLEKKEETKREISRIERKIKNNKFKSEYEDNDYKDFFVKEKNMKRIYFLILILAIIINILLFIFIKNKSKFLIPVVSFLAIYLTYFMNEKKLKNKFNTKLKDDVRKIELEEAELKNEIEKLENEIAENNYLKINEEKELENQINLQKELIKKESMTKINFYDLNDYLNRCSLDEINESINATQENINEIKIKVHTLEVEKNNINNYLEKLSNIEENLISKNKEYDELKKLEKSIILAKEALQIAEKKMKENVNPKFKKNISEYIENITNGKYNQVKIDSNNNIVLERKNGEYISIDNLSIGTIEQIYLSLRLSSINNYTEENMPIILDGTFAFFDNERLENTIKFLNNNFKEKKQIIIFTCTKREIDILNKLKFSYNLIEL